MAELSLCSLDGSLIGTSRDADDVVMVLRKGQTVNVTDTGTPGGLVGWMTYQRNSASSVNQVVVDQACRGMTARDVQLRDEELMLLVKHKRIHLIEHSLLGQESSSRNQNGSLASKPAADRRTLVLKPGSVIGPEEIKQAFDMHAATGITVSREPTATARPLPLPVYFESVSDSEKLFVTRLKKRVAITRADVLFDVEGPRLVTVEVTHLQSLASVLQQVAAVMVGPEFDLTAKDGKLITEANFQSVPDGTALRQVCKDKEITVSFEAATAKQFVFGSRSGAREVLSAVKEAFSLEDGLLLVDATTGKEFMPCWRAVRPYGTYTVRTVTKSVTVNLRRPVARDRPDAGSSSEVVYVTETSDLVSDVANVFNIHSAYFDLAAEGDEGKRLSKEEAAELAMDPAAPGEFVLLPKPIELTLRSFSGAVTVSVTDACDAEIRDVVATLTGMRNDASWDLCYSSTISALERPYYYGQFARPTKVYNVVGKPKNIQLLLGPRPVRCPVAEMCTHAEMLKEIRRTLDIVGEFRVVNKGDAPTAPDIDLAWANIKDAQECSVILGDRCVSVRTEVNWPHDVVAGADEVTISVAPTDTSRDVWDKISATFDLAGVGAAVAVPAASVYLTSPASSEPVHDLSYQNVRPNGLLLLCLPVKTVAVVSLAPSHAEHTFAVVATEAHDSVVKRIESAFSTCRKHKYRLFGPFSSKDDAVSAVKTPDSPRSPRGGNPLRLQEDSLAYRSLPHGQTAFFLLVPPKRLTVVNEGGDAADEVLVSFRTSYSEVLQQLVAAFASLEHPPARAPSHLEDETGARVTSLDYLT
eukprot:gene22793-34929_t